MISPAAEFAFYTPLYSTPKIALVSALLAFATGALLFALRFRKSLKAPQLGVLAPYFGIVCAVVAALFSLVLLVGLDMRAKGTQIIFVLTAGLHVTSMWVGISYLKEKVAIGRL